MHRIQKKTSQMPNSEQNPEWSVATKMIVAIQLAKSMLRHLRFRNSHKLCNQGI